MISLVDRLLVRWLFIVFGCVGSIGLARVASAACDCPTANRVPYCTGSAVSYTANGIGQSGATMTIGFGTYAGSSDYTCGQYANGDVWVLGKGSPPAVVVASATPKWDGQRNGHMTNPGVDTNQLDSRGIIPFSSAPVSLPHTYSVSGGPVSFIKSIGKPTVGVNPYPCEIVGHRTCTQFNHVVTFVASIPDSDADGSTADEFRPGYAGSTKPGPFRIDSSFEARARSLPKLSRSQVPAASTTWTLSHVRDRFRWLSMDHLALDPTAATGQLIGADNAMPSAGSTVDYAHNRAVIAAIGILRLYLDDFNWDQPLSRAALVNVVQTGIDKYSQALVGMRWDHTLWGTNNFPGTRGAANVTMLSGLWQGHKTTSAFAAYMLNHQKLKEWVAGVTPGRFPGARVRDDFAEDEEAYFGVGGIPYYGVCGKGDCTCDFPNQSGQCRVPTLNGDAPCGDGKRYGERSLNHMAYDRLTVTLIGNEQVWNHESYLRLAKTWKDGGRASGHSGYRWCPYNPARSNARDVSSYEHPFGEQMHAAFGRLGSSTGGPPPEASISAPVQIVP